MIIRAKDRQRIQRIAGEVFTAPLEIWAYGSRVTHRAHPCSDLDLVIRTESLRPVDRGQLLTFTELLQESNIPFIVQVFDWAELPDSFRQNILNHYQVFFSSLPEKHSV